MARLADIDWADDRGFGRDVGDFRADRRERLRIALVMIGCGLLEVRKFESSKVRELGVGGVRMSSGERKTLNSQR